MKKVKRVENIAEVEPIIGVLNQRNKPKLILLDDTGENIIQYDEGRPSEKVSFEEAKRVHEMFPDVTAIHFRDYHSEEVSKNAKIIYF